MKTRDWYLTCLMEECFEIILEAYDVQSSVQATGVFRSAALSQELADLVGVFNLCYNHGILTVAPSSKDAAYDKCVDIQTGMLNRKNGPIVGLARLIEALSHLGMRVSKGLRFGLTEIQPGQPLNNAQRIVDAYYEVMGVGMFLHQEGCISFDTEDIAPASQAKIAKVQKFLGYAREVGAVED